MSNSSTTVVPKVTLKVSESTGKDVGRGIARIDPADMQRLGLDVGDMVEVEGKRDDGLPRAAHLQGAPRQGTHLQIDGVVRENARAGLGESAAVRAGRPSSRPRSWCSSPGQTPSSGAT